MLGVRPRLDPPCRPQAWLRDMLICSSAAAAWRLAAFAASLALRALPDGNDSRDYRTYGACQCYPVACVHLASIPPIGGGSVLGLIHHRSWVAIGRSDKTPYPGRWLPRRSPTSPTGTPAASRRSSEPPAPQLSRVAASSTSHAPSSSRDGTVGTAVPQGVVAVPGAARLADCHRPVRRSR